MDAPRCIVEVRWGKLAGTKRVIEPGGRLRVGRTDRADLAVQHDGQMSHVHFDLAWDGERCLLRDAQSITGTQLHGDPVREASVPHGGWIRAGETDFMVYFEGYTQSADAEEYDESEGPLDLTELRRKDAAQDALEVLQSEAEKEPMFALLDGARDGRIVQLLREHVEPHRSLYEGAEGEPLEDVAPYLAGPIHKGSLLLSRLVMLGWGSRWGAWVASRMPFAELRRHFRRFLMVELAPSGERVYFRFVDPGVLVPFLDNAPLDQRRSFLDGVLHITAEQPDNFEVWHAR